MTLQGELSWEEAACFTLQRSEKLFSSADEILQSIVANNLKNNCAGVDRRALEAILLCFSRGSSCKLVASSRKLNGHSRETLRFALKEEMDSHMFHFVDVDLTDAELELIKLNGLLSEETLQREKTRKSLCVIRAPYSSQHLEKKVPTKAKNSSAALQNGHVKPPVIKPVKQSTAASSDRAAADKPEKCTISPNISSKHFHFLQSPNSPLVTANLKNLVNETVFDELPLHIQDELLANLPDCDDSVSALLNNEFFSSALETFRNHLADGLFQSSEFCEKVIAPDRLPPPKMSYSLINEEEHYNITAVSPTKIRIAKSYSSDSMTKQTRNRDGTGSGIGANRLTNQPKKQSTSRVQLQNERVTALKKSTRTRRHNAESKSGHGSNVAIQMVGSDARNHNLPKATRPVIYPLKTKSSQQAILHNLQTRHLMTYDAKIKRPPNTPGGKPSVRFLEPTQCAPVRPVNPASLVNPPDTKSLPQTKTLASAKVYRKRKVSSFSMNNMWLPATSVHTEWIDMSDDDLEYPPLLSTAVPLSVTTTHLSNNDQFSSPTEKRLESEIGEVQTDNSISFGNRASCSTSGRTNGRIFDSISVSRATNEEVMRETNLSPRTAQTVVEKTTAAVQPSGTISSLSCSSSDKEKTSNGHLTNGQTNGILLPCSFLEPKESLSYENGSDVFSNDMKDEMKEKANDSSKLKPGYGEKSDGKFEKVFENGTCSPASSNVETDSGGGISNSFKSIIENEYKTRSSKLNLSKIPKILDNDAVNSSVNNIHIADLVDVNCTEFSKSISSSSSMPSISSSKLKPKSPSLTSTATISNGNSSTVTESAMSQCISSATNKTTATIANNNNNRESPPDPLLNPSEVLQPDGDSTCPTSSQSCGTDYSPTAATTNISCPTSVSELDKLLLLPVSSPLPSSLADVPSGGPELLLTSVPTPVAVTSSGSQKSSNFANN